MPDAPSVVPPLDGCRVLVVEDEIFIGMATEQALRDAGAQRVQIATTLAQARDIFRNGAIDVAILDVLLPDGRSDDLAADMSGRGIAIVLLTGETAAELIDRLPRAVLCRKPSTPAQLIRAVQAALGTR